MENYSAMDMKTLILAQIQEMTSLERDELIDGHFRQCHSLKEGNRPTFLFDMINQYMKDLHSVVSETTRSLNQPTVNFNDIHIQSMMIKGSSSWIGACQVRDVSSRLCSASETQSKEGCIAALEILQQQYEILAVRLEKFMRIEQEIISKQT